MAQHMVKCLYCGEYFNAKPDEENIVWIKPRVNRYAHIKCCKEHEQNTSKEENAFHELYEYVKKEQGVNFNFVQFKKIVNTWCKDYNYTFSGILKSLWYFYEVKGNSKEKFRAGSIGIVPFCYTQAYNYYYNIYIASQLAGSGDYNTSLKREVEIEAPIAKVLPPKLFNLDMEDEDEE